jgi:hypothetical protein
MSLDKSRLHRSEAHLCQRRHNVEKTDKGTISCTIYTASSVHSPYFDTCYPDLWDTSCRILSPSASEQGRLASQDNSSSWRECLTHCVAP